MTFFVGDAGFISWFAGLTGFAEVLMSYADFGAVTYAGLPAGFGWAGMAFDSSFYGAGFFFMTFFGEVGAGGACTGVGGLAGSAGYAGTFFFGLAPFFGVAGLAGGSTCIGYSLGASSTFGPSSSDVFCFLFLTGAFFFFGGFYSSGLFSFSSSFLLAYSSFHSCFFFRNNAFFSSSATLMPLCALIRSSRQRSLPLTLPLMSS